VPARANDSNTYFLRRINRKRGRRSEHARLHHESSLLSKIMTDRTLGDRQQINFQVPNDRLLAQLSRLQVLSRDSSGAPQNSVPFDNLDYPKTGGFFADAGGLAFARHAADGSWVTTQNPATSGERIMILGTGFGATYPPKPVAFPTPAGRFSRVTWIFWLRAHSTPPASRCAC